MHAHAQNFGLRFAVVLCSAILAVSLYVPAEAKATAFHDFYRHFMHPWESATMTVIILMLCVISGVTAAPVFRCGSMMQRMAVAFVLLFPIFIIGRFLLWILHQWSV